MRLAKSSPHKAILVASLLLYIGGLLFPAVEYDAMSSQPVAISRAHLWHEPVGQIQMAPGYFHLALGWLGMLLPPQITPLGWLANPAYFLALLAARWGKAGLMRCFAIAALAFAAFSLVLVNVSPMRVMLHDPVQQFWSAIRPLAGFWLWLAAIITLNVYGFLMSSAPAGTAPSAGSGASSGAGASAKSGAAIRSSASSSSAAASAGSGDEPAHGR
jgi:hypothetical protein